MTKSGRHYWARTVLVVAGLLLVSGANAQQPAKPAAAPSAPSAGGATGKVTGRVLEHGKDPVAYANVRFLGGLRLGALTDENGNFTIAGVPVGTYEMEAAPTGFEKQVQSVTVNAGATTN